MATETGEIPTVAFVLSLIGGLLILGGSGIMFGLARPTIYGGMMGGYYGIMNGYYGMMGGFGGGWFYGLAAVGVLSGIVVILGAIMLYNETERAPTWGALILVFSIVGLLGMGGFFLGAILGAVGGLLAITWKPGA